MLSSYNLLPNFIKNILRKIPGSLRTGLYHRVRNANLREKPKMKQETRKELERYFEEDVKKLEKLSKINLIEKWYH